MVSRPVLRNPEGRRNSKSGGLYRKTARNSTDGQGKAPKRVQGPAMRYLLIASLAAALIGIVLASGLAVAQDALDSRPMTWRGVQMGPEEHFEGDLTINFETSAFRPDGAPAAEALWLAGWEERPGDNGDLPRRYHLVFVGRRTVEPGKYGSLGAYRRTVLITRLISERLLIQP